MSTSRPQLSVWVRERDTGAHGATESMVRYETIASLDDGDRTVIDIVEWTGDDDVLSDGGLDPLEMTPERAEAVGRRLFDLVFTTHVRDLYRSDVDQRLRLFVEPAPLRDLPWELLHDGSRFVTTVVPTSRGVKSANPAHPISIEGPLRVLVVDAQPAGSERLDSTFEAAAIDAALAQIDDADVEVTVRRGVSVTDLIDLFREARNDPEQAPFHVLHVIGHGRERDGTIELLFEDDVEVPAGERPPPVPLDARALTRIVLGPDGADDDVRLIFLNACRSADFAQDGQGDSFAAELVEAGIPAVIGMTSDVLDEFALALATDFYRALGDGLPIDECLAQGRLTAQAINPDYVAEIGLPVLYMRTDDGVLFHRVAAVEPIVPPSQPWWRRAATWVAATVAGTLLSALVFPVGGGLHDWSCGWVPSALTWGCPEQETMSATTFNVAFAGFDAADPDDRAVAESLAKRLASDVTADIEAFGFTEVWGPDRVGVVGGATATERERAAGELADLINADLVVYGRVEPDGRRNVALVPELYVNDNRAEFASANAGEFTGRYRMGEEASIDPNNLVSANDDFANLMRSRTQALTEFVGGLAEYSNRPPDYAGALERFERAEAIEEWQRDEGREIVHLLMGNTYGRLAGQAEAGSPERRARLDAAAAAYEASLAIAPDYARAHLGLAEVVFARAGGLACNRDVDTTGLAASDADYVAALDAADVPDHADVDLRVDFGRARIAVCQRIVGAEPAVDPVPRLERVVAAHDAGNDRIELLAAESTVMLGVVDGLDRRHRDAADAFLHAADRFDELARDDRLVASLWLAARSFEQADDRCDDALDAYRRLHDLVVSLGSDPGFATPPLADVDAAIEALPCS